MIEFKMQLARDLVAVLPDSAKRRAKIFVPDWQKSLQGEVLAIGPKVREVLPGDRVAFGAAKGMESIYQGASIRLMRIDDIDFILDGENDAQI